MVHPTDLNKHQCRKTLKMWFFFMSFRSGGHRSMLSRKQLPPTQSLAQDSILSPATLLNNTNLSCTTSLLHADVLSLSQTPGMLMCLSFFFFFFLDAVGTIDCNPEKLCRLNLVSLWPEHSKRLTFYPQRDPRTIVSFTGMPRVAIRDIFMIISLAPMCSSLGSTTHFPMDCSFPTLI